MNYSTDMILIFSFIHSGPNNKSSSVFRHTDTNYIIYSRVNRHKQLYLTKTVISFTRVQEEDVHWSAKLKVGHHPGAYFPLGGLHARVCRASWSHSC